LPEGFVPNTTQRSRQSVLIVEDHDDTRALLVQLLNMLGYDTVPVATVAEGIERLDGQRFAILDINLPDGLGTSVLQRIRDENRPIRVAITTGTSDFESIDQAHRLSAELILRKPIDVCALIEWMNSAG
jgi:CheY-like chemotaxis protein